jgi:hypothetical protein
MTESLFKEYEKVFEESHSASCSARASRDKKAGEFEFAYSPFALQDAVGEKSAKKSWIEYMKLRLTGIESEKLIFQIAGKARDMLAIIKGATKEDLGIAKDYPYNKSKRDAKNWQEKSLADFYTKLIEAYHGSRMGTRPTEWSFGRGEELDVALEKILLSI